MTCEAMLELMLEADTDELEGQGTSPLAVHVRACARCGAVAQRLTVESQLLTIAVRRVGVVEIGSFAARTRFPRRLMIGGSVFAIAASLVLFVLVQSASRQSADLAASPSVAHGPVFTPQGVGPARPGMHADIRAGVPVPAPLSARRYADATPVAAAPVVPVAVVPAAPEHDAPAIVRVQPPPGVQATVMQTSNPSITVVVLYKPSSGIPK